MALGMLKYGSGISKINVFWGHGFNGCFKCTEYCMYIQDGLRTCRQTVRRVRLSSVHSEQAILEQRNTLRSQAEDTIAQRQDALEYVAEQALVLPPS
jgi:hypothetical protein